MQFLRRLGIKVARRFVGKYHGGLVDECSCYGHPLLFTTRELRRLVVFSVAQIQIGKQFFGSFRGFLFSHAANVSRNADVFDGGELREQVMELEDEADFLVTESSQFRIIQFVDFDAIDAQLSTVGLVQGADDVE